MISFPFAVAALFYPSRGKAEPPPVLAAFPDQVQSPRTFLCKSPALFGEGKQRRSLWLGKISRRRTPLKHVLVSPRTASLRNRSGCGCKSPLGVVLGLRPSQKGEKRRHPVSRA